MAVVSRVLRRAGARRAFSAEPAPAYASERINAATAPTLIGTAAASAGAGS